MITKSQKICTYACAFVAYIAMALIYFDVESVLATGPLILLTGIALMVVSKKTKSPLVLLGAAHSGVAILFFALVVTLGWSPSEATQPFLWMGRAYVVGWTMALFMLRRQKKAAEIEWADLGHTTPMSMPVE